MGGLEREHLYNQRETSNLRTDFMPDNLEVSSKGTSETEANADLGTWFRASITPDDLQARYCSDPASRSVVKTRCL